MKKIVIIFLILVLFISGCDLINKEVVSDKLYIKDPYLFDSPNYECMDIDGGGEYQFLFASNSILELPSGRIMEFEDICLDNHLIKEYGCTNNGAFMSISLDCKGEYGVNCNEGRCDCVIPYEGMEIMEDTLFCPGLYNLNDGIIINNDNLVVECLGTILQGPGGYIGGLEGITIFSDNVTLQNCKITGWENAVLVDTSNSIILNNEIYNNFDGISLSFFPSHNHKILNNNISNNNENGIYSLDISNTTFINNTLNNNMFGISFSQLGGEINNNGNRLMGNKICYNSQYDISCLNLNFTTSNWGETTYDTTDFCGELTTRMPCP